MYFASLIQNQPFAPSVMPYNQMNDMSGVTGTSDQQNGSVANSELMSIGDPTVTIGFSNGGVPKYSPVDLEGSIGTDIV